MNKQKENLYIILPVHNRASITERFAYNISKQTYSDFKVLLIDDGSVDDTCAKVKAILPNRNLEILNFQGGNLWWGGGLQKGYEWLIKNNIPKNHYVLIANDDILFEKDFLENGISLLRLNKNIILSGFLYSAQTGKRLKIGYSIKWGKFSIESTDIISKLDSLDSYALFFRIGDFYKIGGFHPKLIPHYLSDIEFVYRAKQKGFKLEVSKLIKVYIDQTITNEGDIRRYPFFKRCKSLFLKKNPSNPISRAMFIILRGPSFLLKFKALHFLFWQTLETIGIHPKKYAFIFIKSFIPPLLIDILKDVYYFKEKYFLKDSIKDSKIYGEYNFSDTTDWVLKNTRSKVIAVCPDKLCADKANYKNRKLCRLTLRWIDLGILNYKRYPYSYQKKENFIKYMRSIWDNKNNPDTVFVNGPLKIGCFFFSLVSGNPGTKILVYNQGIDLSNTVGEIIKPVKTEGRIILFRIPKKLDRKKIYRLISEFMYAKD